MANIGQLVVMLGVDDKALIKAKKSMEDFGKSAEKSATTAGTAYEKLGGQLYTFGIRAAMYLTAPLTAFGIASFQAAKDFEASMQKIVGLVGESQKQVNQWSKELLSLGPALGQAPKEMADALYFITSSGFKGAQAMDILEKSAMAASAGMGTVKSVADLVTSAMNAYSKEGLTASRTLDIMTAAIREGKIEATAFAQQVGQILPIASEMGVSFDEVTAAMAAMSLTGTNASEAAVYLRGILNSLQGPGKQARDALIEMGTSAEQLQGMLRVDLLGTLKKLSDLLKENSADMLDKVIPNIRAMTGFLSLMGQNYEKNVKVFREVYTSTGSLEKAFAAVANTLQYRYNVALAKTQAAFIRVGMALKDNLVPLMEAFGNIVEKASAWFSNLAEPIQKLITYFVAILAAIGPVTLVFSFWYKFILPNLIKLIAALRAGMQLLSAAIAANGVLLVGAGIAMAAYMVYMKFFKKEADDAAESQKALNEQIKIAGERSMNMRNFQAYSTILKDLNARQLTDMLDQVNSQIAKTEDAITAMALAESAAMQTTAVTSAATTASKKSDLRSWVVSSGIAAATIVGINGEMYIKLVEFAKKAWEAIKKIWSGDATLQSTEILTESIKKQIDEFNKKLAEGPDENAYLAFLKDLQKEIQNLLKGIQNKEELSESVKSAWEEMLKQEQVIMELIPIMKRLGIEYDSNGALIDLYTSNLKVFAALLPASSKQMKELETRLRNMGVAALEVNKIMEDYAASMAAVEAKNLVLGEGWNIDAFKEKLNIAEKALETLRERQYRFGDTSKETAAAVKMLEIVIASMTGTIDEADVKFARFKRVMDTFKAGEEFVDAKASLGGYYDALELVNDRIRNTQEALEGLFRARAEGEAPPEMFGNIAQLQTDLEGYIALQKELVLVMQQNQIVADGLTNTFSNLGTAIVEGTSGLQNMVVGLLGMLQQIILMRLRDALITKLQEKTLAAYNKRLGINTGLQISNAVATEIAATANTGNAIASSVDTAAKIGNTAATEINTGAKVANAGASIIEKSTSKMGIIGLIVAAAGIAALIALVSSMNSKSKSATKMAGGGVVPSGYPNDSFPALLTSGEEVIPANQRREQSISVNLDGKFLLRNRDLWLAVQRHEAVLEDLT